MSSSIGTRKLVSVSGWAKHGVLYEFTSLAARAKNFRAHEAKDPSGVQTRWIPDQVRHDGLRYPGPPQ
jgi:hypothetical protein